MGITQTLTKPFDLAFVTFGGVWAEAQYHWLNSDDGLEFDSWFDATFMTQPSDWNSYNSAISLDPWRATIPQSQREAVWRQELENGWPLIEKLANRLLVQITLYDVSLIRGGEDVTGGVSWSGQPWTPIEDSILLCANSIKEAAYKLRRTVGACQQRRHKLRAGVVQ